MIEFFEYGPKNTNSDELTEAIKTTTIHPGEYQ